MNTVAFTTAWNHDMTCPLLALAAVPPIPVMVLFPDEEARITPAFRWSLLPRLHLFV